VVVVDYGASVVRRVTFDGRCSVVADRLAGNAVALGRDLNGKLLIGTWSAGYICRVAAR
jgi:virginiamycin B lyase